MSGAFAPLRHRGFALVWGSGMVSNAGSWMQTVAVGSFVKAETGRDALVAVAGLAAFLPIGLLSPVGGALADRVDRRRFLTLLNCFEAAVAGLLAAVVAFGGAGPALVLGLVFIEGCSSALRIPVQQAMLPDLVPPGDLLGAVALGSAQYNVGRVAGPLAAAGVIALGGVGTAFAVNAASFSAVVVALRFVHLPPPIDDGGGAGVLRRIADGARVGWAEPGCRAGLVLVGLLALLVAPFIALVAGRAGALVGTEQRALARATGALTAAQGVGAVVGALTLPSVAARLGRRLTIVGCVVASAALVVAYAWAPTLLLAALAMALLGAAYIGALSGLQAVVQLRAPTAYRGRVVSLFLVALGTLYPVGALVQGAAGDQVGLRWATTAGAAALVVAVAAWALARPASLRPLDLEAAPATAP